MLLKNLNILFVTAHFPYPIVGGERVKQYHIIKHLAKNNNVNIVSFDRNYPVTENDVKQMKEMGIESYVFHLNKFKSYFSAALYSPFRHPLEIEFFWDGRFRNKINEIIRTQKIDLIINYFLRTAEFVKNFKIKKILMAEDCRWFYQQKTYKISKNPRQKLIRYFESVKLRNYESAIMDYFDLTTLVSQKDLDCMKTVNQNAKLEILTNGVDTEKYLIKNNSENRKDLIFVGKLDVWINRLMLNKIINKIFPKIKSQIHDIKLHIVGANPAKDLLKKSDSNIIVHNYIEDFSGLLNESAVFLHPHEGGSGIQNKLLEAMACGCPVVTSVSGANGIEIINGETGFIANTYNDFIRYALNILNDLELRKKISANSRAYIEKHHKWEYVFQKLDEQILNVMNS